MRLYYRIGIEYIFGYYQREKEIQQKTDTLTLTGGYAHNDTKRQSQRDINGLAASLQMKKNSTSQNNQ